MKRSLEILILAGLFVVNAADALAADAKKELEKKNAGVDWQKLLSDLRTRFAASADTALQQTRIDRAYFELNTDDPDQPPFLVFKGVTLRTAHDEENAMKELLAKELAKLPVPNVKFVVKLDAIAFHESPIYKLQEAAVSAYKADATFNNFFERATYGPDGTLQLHVLCLRYDKATDSKLAKLVKDNPPAAELTQFPDGKQKAPSFVRRDYDWLADRLAQQQKFAADSDPLLQRTRLNDGYLHYSKDHKKVHFNVSGVCIHPPGLIAEAERDKRWKARVSNLFPKVVYEPTVESIVMIPNPSIAWQNDVAGDPKHDGVFFQLARFDAAGELTWIVKSPGEQHRAGILKRIEENPAWKQLAPASGKSPIIQLWNWDDVLPTGQSRLAEGDFVLHRARLDRTFLRYDDPKLGDPYFHVQGVSLHPIEVEPADKQRPKLEEALAGLVPGDLEHKWNSSQMRFIMSPIYPLQADVVARSIEGMLFANGRYDRAGKLHLAVALAIEEQKETAAELVKDLKMPEGAIGKRDDAKAPKLDFTVLAWNNIFEQMQTWLARDNDTLFKKTRVDRGYFSYPASKIGPDLRLISVGLYPIHEEYIARLKKHLGLFVDLYFKDQLRAGPVNAIPVVQHVEDPIPVLQTKVAETPPLDGVRLDDVSFHRDGKLAMHGIWIGADQRRDLQNLIEKTLTDDHPAIQRGFHWGSMQAFDSPGLLHDMRVWVAGQEAIDEVWLERFFFDAMGKVRITGLFTRQSDKDKALAKLPDFLPKFESKKLPAIQPPVAPKEPEKKEPEKKEPEKKDDPAANSPVLLLQEEKEQKAQKDDGPFKLDLLPNIGQYLRDSIPKVAACDGLRIDRCYYEANGIFRIDGLADHESHADELKRFLDAGKVPFDRQRQLPNGWGEGRQIVIPLRPMMVSLHENLPSLPEFDGLSIHRAHHDPKNQLVFSASAIGDSDPKVQAELLKTLLETHPRWRLRTSAGVVVNVTERKKADHELAKKHVMSALHLLQVNIGEAYVVPIPPEVDEWLTHAWPFEPKLPRVRPTNDDYDRCLDYLDVALRHDPKNVLAWYLRGYILQTRSRSDLSLRDYRRMVELELDDKELRPQRIEDLELVQGALRQSAYRIEQQAILEVSDGWTLRELRERKEK